MSRTLVLAFVVAIALAIALLWQKSPLVSNVQHESAAPQLAGNSGDSSIPQRHTARVPDDGSAGSQALQGGTPGFDEVLACNAYREISRGMSNEELAQNMASVGKLSSEDAARFNKRLDYYQSHRASCEGFDYSQAYDAAAAAVVRGNAIAGECLLSGSLPEPQDEAALAELYKRYPKYAQDALQLGLQRGDWSTIIAAAGGIRAPHGITGRMGLTAEQKYLLLKLAYLASDTESLQRMYGYELAKLADDLGSQKIADVSRRADEIFNSSFHGRKPPADRSPVCSSSV